MTGHSVIVAGGEPTGLMLAGELALAGVDVAIVERRCGRRTSGAYWPAGWRSWRCRSTAGGTWRGSRRTRAAWMSG